MPMYNLSEYNKNYREITGSLWNYYRDERNNPPLNDDNPPTLNYNADLIKNSASFKYKSSIKGKTLDNDDDDDDDDDNNENNNRKKNKNVEIVVPLKHLTNFWRPLDMSLINCEINLVLT